MRNEKAFYLRLTKEEKEILEDRADSLRIGQSDFLRRMIVGGELACGTCGTPPGTLGLDPKKERASVIVKHINIMRKKIDVYKDKLIHNESIGVEELKELVSHMQEMVDEFVAILKGGGI